MFADIGRHFFVARCERRYSDDWKLCSGGISNFCPSLSSVLLSQSQETRETEYEGFLK